MIKTSNYYIILSLTILSLISCNPANQLRSETESPLLAVQQKEFLGERKPLPYLKLPKDLRDLTQEDYESSAVCHPNDDKTESYTMMTRCYRLKSADSFRVLSGLKTQALSKGFVVNSFSPINSNGNFALYKPKDVPKEYLQVQAAPSFDDGDVLLRIDYTKN